MLITYLPPEIITYIFLRLPIKALVILKCVNKSFFHLISSPEFVRDHLRISIEEASLSSYRIIVPDGPSCSLKQLTFESLFGNYWTDFVSLDYPRKDLYSPRASLVGSCNGLVCIVMDNKYLVVWNPCIGKYKKISNANSNKESLSFTYGFGYDESEDDYKIVCVFDWYGSKVWHEFVVKVYSLKRNSWKRLEDYKGDVLDCDTAKPANGKLHWFTCQLESNYTKKIVSFDVENEVFGIVEQPNYGVSGYHTLSLGVLEGCICVVCSDETGRSDLWVMMEHGVKESWTKIVTFSFIDILEEDYDCLRPWFILPNGEILLDTTDSFVIYNPIGNSFRLPMIRKWDYLKEPVIYVESLVSPIVNGRRRR